MEKPEKLKNKQLSYAISDTLDSGSNLMHFIPTYYKDEEGWKEDLWPILMPTSFNVFSDYIPKLNLNNISQYMLSGHSPSGVSKKRNIREYISCPYKEFSEFINEVGSGFRKNLDSPLFYVQRNKKFFEARFAPQDGSAEILLGFHNTTLKDVIEHPNNFFKVSKR